jgi:hypothetical protein
MGYENTLILTKEIKQLESALAAQKEAREKAEEAMLNTMEASKNIINERDAQLVDIRKTCAMVYQWAGANDFPVEILDNLADISQGLKPRHVELPVAINLAKNLINEEIRKARLEEAKWWHPESCPHRNLCESKMCRYCQRIAALSGKEKAE